MRSPPSTLSRRNAPPSGRSLANAETGVSRSASRSRTTGTSSRVFFVVAVSTTRLQTKTLARSRDEGSWCHPILARHRWRTLCLRGHGAPELTVGFRASLENALQDAVSRDPFAPLPPPGLTPLAGSLSVFRSLVAPARATFAKTVAPGRGPPTGQGAPGVGAPRRGRGPEPGVGLKRSPL